MSTSAAQRLSPSFPLPAPRGTAGALRAWQQAALDEYAARQPRDFLAVATPGAGKTTFALRLASRPARAPAGRGGHRGGPDRAPEAAVGGCGRPGRASRSTPRYANGQGPVGGALPRGRADVRAGRRPPAAAPQPHRADARPWSSSTRCTTAATRCRWGDAIREAFDPAARRLALTGTPFRSDINPIPFVAYAPGSRRRPAARSPTTPTATPTRSATGSCGRWCSWPTRGRCGGAPGPATRSPPGSASR